MKTTQCKMQRNFTAASFKIFSGIVDRTRTGLTSPVAKGVYKHILLLKSKVDTILVCTKVY